MNDESWTLMVIQVQTHCVKQTDDTQCEVFTGNSSLGPGTGS